MATIQVSQPKCNACDKTVYLVDKLTADKRVFHKACFRCHHCNGTLKLSNYNSFEGVLYCRPHYDQLFKRTGSLDKSFEGYILWHLWSIWIARNDMIFNDKKASVADLLFHSKLRALIWLKASLAGSIGDLEGWWDNPLCVVYTPLLQAAARSTIFGRLTFSIVGLAFPNHVGCGGILRSENGTIRAIFLGSVALLGYILVEIQAIQVALEIFFEASFAENFELVVESRSFSVINWLNNPLQRPWIYWRNHVEIDMLVHRLKSVNFSHVSGSGNASVVWLAKDGMRRNKMFKAWWSVVKDLSRKDCEGGCDSSYQLVSFADNLRSEDDRDLLSEWYPLMHGYGSLSPSRVLDMFLGRGRLGDIPETSQLYGLSNYNSFEGVLYCRPHYDQLFKRTGSLSKSFEGTPKIVKPERQMDNESAAKVMNMFGGTKEKCKCCNKVAYPIERVTVNRTIYHKSCFKCTHGGCTISPSNYIAHEGKLYCKHHHIQLFRAKGNYSQLEASDNEN
ncbi:hypothetical protein GQ457_06G002990 [Hibiscus cannabinus]